MSRLVSTLATFALALAASAATADRALVLGASEAERRGLFVGGKGIDTAQALRDAGFDVVTADAGSVQAMRAALSEFMQDVEDQERVVVHLSGTFVRGAGQNWMLQTSLDRMPDVATVGDVGLSMDTVLGIVQAVQGAAVVALGEAVVKQEPGIGLKAGVQIADVPQGVTLARGSSNDVARFVATDLLQTGRSLSSAIDGAKGVTGQGFLSKHVVFLPDGEERPTAPPNAAEVERAIWQATTAQDSVEAYEGYLRRYPEGFFVQNAREAIDSIQNEPNRIARIEEDALKLTRPQRRVLQQQLTLLEYQPRGVDGIFGPSTRAAVTRFQVKNGFPGTGFLNKQQIDRLGLQSERRQEELAAAEKRERLELEAKDRAAWAVLGGEEDEAGVRTYLERYPEGLFSPIARERLAAMEAERQELMAQQDRTDWDVAASAGTEAAFRAYLEAHPDGAFAAQAKDRIEALAGADSESQKAALAAEATLGLTPVTRMLVEQRLDQIRMAPGTVDGTFDDETRAAIRRFQRARGLEVTGFMNEAVAARMLADFGSFLIPGR